MIALTTRVLADLVIIGCLAALGVFAKAFAEGGLAIAGTEIPWSALITGGISLLTAGLTLMVRKEMGAMHITFNSKMDKFMETIAAKSKAEGVLEEKERTAAAAVTRAEGVAEGKGLTS